MIDVAGRRAFVKFAMTRKLSARRACELVKVSRRRLRYLSRRNDEELEARLKDLAMKTRRGWKAGCGRGALAAASATATRSPPSAMPPATLPRAVARSTRAKPRS